MKLLGHRACADSLLVDNVKIFQINHGIYALVGTWDLEIYGNFIENKLVL